MAKRRIVHSPYSSHFAKFRQNGNTIRVRHGPKPSPRNRARIPGLARDVPGQDRTARSTMVESSDILVLTPAGLIDETIAIAASRSGARGILDLEFATDAATVK